MTTKAAKRIEALDQMIAQGDDGDALYANRLNRELVELQYAILTKQVALTIDDLRERVRAASKVIKVTASLPS